MNPLVDNDTSDGNFLWLMNRILWLRRGGANIFNEANHR